MSDDSQSTADLGPGVESRKPADGEQISAQKSDFPTTLSDLTFRSSLDPATNNNIYKTLSALRKSTLSIPNRLLSVLQDAEFIEGLYHHLNQYCPPDVHLGHPFERPDHDRTQEPDSEAKNETHTWPLVPNERSGSWPLPPQLKNESQQAYLSSSNDHSQSSSVSAYFKSTDGHVNQWSFSTRRLNLPVLSILGSAGGAMLIDTTRRGKAYPDALRRTVPIFVSVWNHVLFDELAGSGVCNFQGFGLEPGEVSQIERRLPTFVRDLKGLGLSLDEVRNDAKRPVRCVWVAQPISRSDWNLTFEDVANQVKEERTRWEGIGGVNILICCSASRRVLGAEMSDEGYIQGAGDDSEGWSQGLTAKVFWSNKDELLRLVEAGEDVEDLMRTIIKRDSAIGLLGNAILVKPTKNLYLGPGTGDLEKFGLIIDCNAALDANSAKLVGLGCKEGKLGSKTLREQLPKARDVVEKVLRKSLETPILVRCSTGKDLSVGVILTILCSFYEDKGKHSTYLCSILSLTFFRNGSSGPYSTH